MCGIAGIVDASLAPISEREIARMTRIQAHRGPDDEGTWIGDGCALGHRRLAILDPRPEGRQPMTLAGAPHLQVVFNGEIYNFRELRKRLEARGREFRTGTDTEVLLAGFAEWGERVVDELDGMFAFGIWNAERRELFLARDRFGKKPLFWARRGGQLRFASEIQALVASGAVDVEPDPWSIDVYLTWGYVPAPHTALRDVRKLPPASRMWVRVADGALRVASDPYWSLHLEPKYRVSERDAVDHVRDLLDAAVGKRLVSDVPLGAFLSGGVDSSTVVGLMARRTAERVRTFSVAFREGRYDERAWARKVAEHWNTDHTEFDLAEIDFDVVSRIARLYGEPNADSSTLAAYLLAEQTKPHVTVVLGGDGADEIFNGYERHLAYWALARGSKIRGARSVAHFVEARLPKSPDRKSRWRSIERFIEGFRGRPDEAYARWMTIFPSEDRRRLYGPELRQAVATHRRDSPWHLPLSSDTHFHPLDAVLRADVESYLPYDILPKLDLATMAHGVEARSPFLDQDLASFVARLPPSIRCRRPRRKDLLLRAAGPLLPEGVAGRRKAGFGLPIDDWFRGRSSAGAREILTRGDSGFGGIRQEEVGRIFDEHLERRADRSDRLWALLVLELWYEEMKDLRQGRHE